MFSSNLTPPSRGSKTTAKIDFFVYFCWNSLCKNVLGLRLLNGAKIYEKLIKPQKTDYRINLSDLFIAQRLSWWIFAKNTDKNAHWVSKKCPLIIVYGSLETYWCQFGVKNFRHFWRSPTVGQKLAKTDSFLIVFDPLLDGFMRKFFGHQLKVFFNALLTRYKSSPTDFFT